MRFQGLVAQRLFLVAIATFSCGLFISWVVASSLVSPQQLVVGSLPDDLAGESFTLQSDSGTTLAGWHIPAQARNGVVVLVHGIRSSRLDMLDRARLFRKSGYSIVMIDLQAHGESPGAYITMGYLEQYDVKAAVNFARQTHPAEPVGVLGVSLGGAAALLGSPLEVDAMVLESVFPDIEDAVRNRVARFLGPLAQLPTAMLLAQLEPRAGIEPASLRPIQHIATVGCPVLIASGSEDLHTTLEETRRMYSLAIEPKELWVVTGAAHVDLFKAAPEEYSRRVVNFFRQHLHKK